MERRMLSGLTAAWVSRDGCTVIKHPKALKYNFDLSLAFSDEVFQQFDSDQF